MKLSITVFRKKEETPVHVLGISEIMRKASDFLKETDTMSFTDIIDDETEITKDYECPIHDIIHHSAEGCPMCLLESSYKTVVLGSSIVTNEILKDIKTNLKLKNPLVFGPIVIKDNVFDCPQKRPSCTKCGACEK